MTDWDDATDAAFDDAGDRAEAKRDRLARLLGVLGVLQASGEAGIRPDEIARRTGMSKRSRTIVPAAITWSSRSGCSSMATITGLSRP